MRIAIQEGTEDSFSAVLHIFDLHVLMAIASLLNNNARRKEGE